MSLLSDVRDLLAMTHDLAFLPVVSEPIDRAPVVKVLHIAEALGGGLMSALKDYIDNSDGSVENVVLAQPRSGHDTGDFAGIPMYELGSIKSPIKVVRRILEVVRAVRPDVIHLHSSWAGFVCRLLPLGTRRIVYTPHCYAFERQDVSSTFRLVFWFIERVLARRTAVVAAVSPREAHLATTLRAKQAVRYIPNIAGDQQHDPSGTIPQQRQIPRIVTTGRIMAQKDPAWFKEFVGELRRRQISAHVLWLGGGDPKDEAELREIGVHVTGWIDRRSLLAELAHASLYVHTAAWEGAPLSVLEAAALRVPVFARRIASLESLQVPFLFETPADMADAVAHATTRGSWNELVDLTVAFSCGHTASVQADALRSLYAGFSAHTAVPEPAPVPQSRPELIKIVAQSDVSEESASRPFVA